MIKIDEARKEFEKLRQLIHQTATLLEEQTSSCEEPDIKISVRIGKPGGSVIISYEMEYMGGGLSKYTYGYYDDGLVKVYSFLRALLSCVGNEKWNRMNVRRDIKSSLTELGIYYRDKDVTGSIKRVEKIRRKYGRIRLELHS